MLSSKREATSTVGCESTGVPRHCNPRLVVSVNSLLIFSVTDTKFFKAQTKVYLIIQGFYVLLCMILSLTS